MAKIVEGAAIIAGAVIATILTGGAASPLLVAAWGTAILSAAASIGASLILAGVAQALQHELGTTVALRQAAAPQTVVYGRSRVGGVIVYMSLTGSSDKYLHMVIVHASHAVQAISALYLDGKLVVLGGGNTDDGNTHYDDSGVAYNFKGHVYWETRLGSPTNTNFSVLSSMDSNWPVTAICAGHAVSYIRLQYDASIFPNGIPGVRVDIIGKNDIYDPRSGTRGYSENWALCVTDVLCSTDYGLQCNYVTEIDEPQLIAAANTCDEQVLLINGDSEARYSCNGTFTTEQAAGDILSSMMTAAAGRIAYVGGLWKIFPAVWVGPTITLSDSDLLSPLKWLPKRKYRELYNAVKGSFVCPTYPYVSAGPGLSYGQKITGIFDGEWRQTDVPPYAQDTLHGYASDANYAADGNTRLWLDTRFPFTISVATAQRLMKIMLLRNRQQGTGSAVFKLSAYQARVLDVVQFNHPRFSWSNKLLEIANFRLNFTTEQGKPPTLSVELDLQETDPSVYSWSAVEELGIEDNPPPQLPNMAYCQPPTNLVLASDPTTAVTGADGIKRSRILATWTSPTDAFILRGGKIELQYQETGASTWYPFAQFDGGTTTAYIGSVNDGVTYNIQVRAVNTSGAYSDWLQGSITVSNTFSTVTASNVHVNGTQVL